MIFAAKNLLVFLFALPLAMAGFAENYNAAAASCAGIGGTVMQCNSISGDSIGSKQTTKITFDKIKVRSLLKCEGDDVNAFACVYPIPNDKQVIGLSVFDLEGSAAEYFGNDQTVPDNKDSLCSTLFNLVGKQTSLRTICKGTDKRKYFKITQELKII